METSSTPSRCQPTRNRMTLVGAVHLLLVRSPDIKILMLRRKNTGYEDGNYSVPAGHIDPGESATEAMIREAAEEIGVVIGSDDLRMVHVMHRRSVGTDCTNSERMDLFFTAWNWEGVPHNREPQKCDDLIWAPLSNLPFNTVEYVERATRYYRTGQGYSEAGWNDPCPKCGSSGRA